MCVGLGREQCVIVQHTAKQNGNVLIKVGRGLRVGPTSWPVGGVGGGDWGVSRQEARRGRRMPTCTRGAPGAGATPGRAQLRSLDYQAISACLKIVAA